MRGLTSLVSMVPLQITSDPATPAAADIRRMFDEISPRYDLCNCLLSLGMDQHLRKAAVGLARLPDDGLLLDLCTGTADVIMAARKKHPRVRAVGIDFSGAMLRRAQAKLLQDGGVAATQTALVQADCLSLPVCDSTFDAVTVAWGVRNLTDAHTGFAEMARVLKEGGRLVVLEFSRPRSSLVRGAFDICFGMYSRMVGLLAPGGGRAYRYLPESIARFPSPDELSAMIAGCGLEVERVDVRLLGCVCAHVAVKPG